MLSVCLFLSHECSASGREHQKTGPRVHMTRLRVCTAHTVSGCTERIPDTKGLITQISWTELSSYCTRRLRPEFHNDKKRRGVENCQGNDTGRKSTSQWLFSRMCTVLMANQTWRLEVSRQVCSKGRVHVSPLLQCLTSVCGHEKPVCPKKYISALTLCLKFPPFNAFPWALSALPATAPSHSSLLGP